MNYHDCAQLWYTPPFLLSSTIACLYNIIHALFQGISRADDEKPGQAEMVKALAKRLPSTGILSKGQLDYIIAGDATSQGRVVIAVDVLIDWRKRER